ncbi:hypothetical protein [Ekhidna sp.]
MSLRLIFLLGILLFLLSRCVNNVQEPAIDCSLSDLELGVVSSVKSDCDQPGSVTLLASGGTGTFTYSSNGIDFQSSPTIEGLFAGNLEFFVKEIDECVVSTLFTLEAEDTGITFNTSSSPSDCIEDTGSILLEASGGVGDITFSLDGGSFQAATAFEDISAGSYTVAARDEEGCVVEKSVTVDVISTTSLTSDVMPIISANCAVSGCHNGSQSPNLSTKSQIISSAQRVKARTGGRSMPPSGREDLSASEIEIIACWVDAGAKDN